MEYSVQALDWRLMWWLCGGCLTFIAPSSSVSIRQSVSQSVSQSLHAIIQALPPPSVSRLLLNRYLPYLLRTT